MRRFLIIILVMFSFALPAAWAEDAPSEPVGTELPTSRYEQCTAMVEVDAAQALDIASKWYAESGGTGALHCRGLALFKLGRYDAAARLLESLTLEMEDASPSLWGNVVLQAGYAHKRAGNLFRAVDNYSLALRHIEQQEEPERYQRLTHLILLERGRIYHLLGKDLAAVQDFDHILIEDAQHPEALLGRALSYLALNEDDLARQDYDILTEISPDIAGIEALRKKLQ